MLGKSNLKNWQLECDPFISGWPLLSGILFVWVLEFSEFQGLEMVGEILQNFKMEIEKRLETYGSCKKVTVPVWKFSIFIQFSAVGIQFWGCKSVAPL